MKFTAVDHNSPFPQHAYCRGANHSDMGDVGWCGECGQLVARVDKPGQPKFLANTHHAGQYQTLTYYCFSRHECDPERKVAYLAELDRKIAEGQIIKGAEVEVYKGRKVPVGTIGVVRWMGIDQWGNERVGLSVAGQDKLVYTAKSNVRSTATIGGE